MLNYIPPAQSEVEVSQSERKWYVTCEYYGGIIVALPGRNNSVYRITVLHIYTASQIHIYASTMILHISDKIWKRKLPLI